MLIRKKLLAALAPLLIAGCATSAVESEFGNSVRHMVNAQKANPEASRDPNPEMVDGTDAGRVYEAVNAYRSDVSKPEDVKQDIILRVGGGR